MCAVDADAKLLWLIRFTVLFFQRFGLGADLVKESVSVLLVWDCAASTSELMVADVLSPILGIIVLFRIGQVQDTFYFHLFLVSIKT